ncbi:hypothetical protein SLE2022_235140 [Rubroshorea leprosula]
MQQPKSCVMVYKASKIILTVSRRSKRGRLKKDAAKNPLTPNFMPNLAMDVVDESLTDSNINNYNNYILRKMKAFGAREIWDFAKLIGVVATGKEEEVLRRLK